MRGPVEQALHAVSDEESFVHFVRTLAADFAAEREEVAGHGMPPGGPGPRGWENGSIDTFLDAAVSWVEDSRGRQVVAPNPWRRCADILYAGKFYE